MLTNRGSRIARWPFCIGILVFAVGASLFGQPSATSPSIRWSTNLDEAFRMAKLLDKPLLVEFMAEWCPSCRAMEDTTFRAPAVVDRSDRFVAVRIDVDKQKDTATRYKSNARKYGGIGIPNFLFLDKDGEKIAHLVGYMDAGRFAAVLDSVLALPVSAR